MCWGLGSCLEAAQGGAVSTEGGLGQLNCHGGLWNWPLKVRPYCGTLGTLQDMLPSPFEMASPVCSWTSHCRSSAQSVLQELLPPALPCPLLPGMSSQGDVTSAETCTSLSLVLTASPVFEENSLSGWTRLGWEEEEVEKSSRLGSLLPIGAHTLSRTANPDASATLRVTIVPSTPFLAEEIFRAREE